MMKKVIMFKNGLMKLIKFIKNYLKNAKRKSPQKVWNKLLNN
jgi:hypothetical protein